MRRVDAELDMQMNVLAMRGTIATTGYHTLRNVYSNLWNRYIPFRKYSNYSHIAKLSIVNGIESATFKNYVNVE